MVITRASTIVLPNGKKPKASRAILHPAAHAWQDNGEEVLGDRLAQVKTRPESTPRTAAAEGGAPLSVTKESKAGDS